MRKVMTLVGTRPELIKLSLVIAEFDKHVEHVLVHSGQNYDHELNGVFFHDLKIRKPDHFLNAAAETATQTVANVIERFDKVLENEKPDAVVLLGDTNSCLGAYSAKRRRIPVFHLEAGNRCFDERVPEEINRRIVDTISDVNLTYTEHARRYLLREGFSPDRVFKIGSPMGEVLDRFKMEIEKSDALEKYKVTRGEYFIASTHREENVDSPERLRMLVETLRRLHSEFRIPVLFSTHPRTRTRLEQSGVGAIEGISFLKPLGFFDYVKLQRESKCVLSDSGTLTEEAALLGLSAVMLREAHERPEGMDEGILIMSGLNADNVVSGVRIVCASGGRRQRMPEGYDVYDVSTKVLRIVLSYIDYVKRKVWQEYR